MAARSTAGEKVNKRAMFCLTEHSIAGYASAARRNIAVQSPASEPAARIHSKRETSPKLVCQSPRGNVLLSNQRLMKYSGLHLWHVAPDLPGDQGVAHPGRRCRGFLYALKLAHHRRRRRKTRYRASSTNSYHVSIAPPTPPCTMIASASSVTHTS